MFSFLTSLTVSQEFERFEVVFGPFPVSLGDARWIIHRLFHKVHTQESHMKYRFAELGITFNIHFSIDDESNIKFDDDSMIG